MTNEEKHKLLTLSAFTIGFLLIDDLNSTEQNALGGFFMLLGQTLCTNASFKFYTDQAAAGAGLTNEQQKEVLKKARDTFDKTVNNL